jgi:hypothetical protein
MDTKTLINEAKARFNHNSAKQQLKDKYQSKLIVADQGGLWEADTQLISFLNSMTSETLVLTDKFHNLVEVNRMELLQKLSELYTTVMSAWYKESKELESNR